MGRVRHLSDRGTLSLYPPLVRLRPLEGVIIASCCSPVGPLFCLRVAGV